MRKYLIVLVISFFISFFQYTFLNSLLVKYSPDISLILLTIYYIHTSKKKIYAEDVRYFMAFCLGLFGSLFSNIPLGLLSIYYVVILILISFLSKHTSHVLAVLYMSLLLGRFAFLFLYEVTLAININYSLILLNCMITFFVFILSFYFLNNNNSRSTYDK